MATEFQDDLAEETFGKSYDSLEEGNQRLIDKSIRHFFE